MNNQSLRQPTENIAGFQTRLDAIDFLRGLVIVIMALDHSRAFFTNVTEFEPTDLSKTTAALFITRWITHFCAPTFVFLAGIAAYIYGSRGNTKAELSRFLFTRGLWLILLELTFIRCLGWYLNFNYAHTRGGVIWAIGWSMIVLAGLIHLPMWVIIAFGFTLITGHNLLDSWQIESFDSLRWLWAILHVPNDIQLRPGIIFFTQYPLIPWIGVMAIGYCFGALFKSEQQARRALFIRLGIIITALFFIIRLLNRYGDPVQWTAQKNNLFTFFSILNCEKYPPSLSFLLMTLGPAIITLGIFDRDWSGWKNPFIIFGRVPMFFYLLHLPLLRVGVIADAVAKYGAKVFSLATDKAPPGWGHDLPMIYLIWLAVILMLYPVCRWFAEYKQRNRDVWWLSYL